MPCKYLADSRATYLERVSTWAFIVVLLFLSHHDMSTPSVESSFVFIRTGSESEKTDPATGELEDSATLQVNVLEKFRIK